MTARALTGTYAWVVGGAGVIGTGLARGLLRAGATVIVNSRHKARLEALSEDLGHPERLIPLHGSMLADEAEQTVAAAMEITGGALDHVVTHSAVRWWAGPKGSCDETNTLGSLRGKLLSLTHEQFAEQAALLPTMQFAACRLLVPRLEAVEGASYTFVTGGAGGDSRSPLGQINAQAVWGLAAALRSETHASPLKVHEVRLGLRFNRSHPERLAEPRSSPLSHELGCVVAGIAAAPAAEVPNGLHEIFSQAELEAAKARFPVADQAYPVFFSPEL